MRTLLLFVKNIGLFFLAPFIALAYIMVLPIVGMYCVIRLSMDLLHKKIQTSRKVGSCEEISTPH